MQFVVFEKIYECLFIPNCTRKIIWLPVNNIHEKISPCWLVKKFRHGWAGVTHAYHAIREKLRHPGRALDLKTKDLIGHLEFLFRDFPVNQFNFKFLHLISTFWTNFVFLHSKNFKFLHCLGLIDMLSANQQGEIFSWILLRVQSHNCECKLAVWLAIEERVFSVELHLLLTPVASKNFKKLNGYELHERASIRKEFIFWWRHLIRGFSQPRSQVPLSTFWK